MYRNPRNKSDIMRNTPAVKSRMIARSTAEWFDAEGVRYIRYHDTDVVKVQNNKVTLNSNNFRTVTTKERMNTELRKLGFQIGTEKGVWYVYDRDHKYTTFYDGITLEKGKPLPPIKADILDKEEVKRKLIKRYVDAVKALPVLPIPSLGDCLFCLGNKTSHYCLMAHLEEQYIHGTLIVNALLDAGYRDEQLPLVYAGFIGRDAVVRSVRKYFKKYV